MVLEVLIILSTKGAVRKEGLEPQDQLDSLILRVSVGADRDLVSVEDLNGLEVGIQRLVCYKLSFLRVVN